MNGGKGCHGCMKYGKVVMVAWNIAHAVVVARNIPKG
jgi:hypothetical protein